VSEIKDEVFESQHAQQQREQEIEEQMQPLKYSI